MSRLRSAAQRAPQTKDQALELAARFAALSALRAEAEAQRAAEKAAIDAAADAVIVPIDAERADIQKRLKPWFEGNFDGLTGGKRKSIELGGCLLGYRINPPKVYFAGGTDKDAVQALLADPTGRALVRAVLSPDKPEILKVLEAEQAAIAAAREAGSADVPEAPIGALGFSIRQTEVFFVDAGPHPAEPASIEVRG